MINNPYYPFIPPFKYDRDGYCIFDSKNDMIADVRGWGYLTGRGALALSEEEAIKIQDRIGAEVARAMNESGKVVDAGEI